MTKIRKGSSPLVVGPIHCLKDNQIKDIQKSLLEWYSVKKRVLPWRSIAQSEKDDHKRAYAVWVSEIMLQQTQVATVISYFNKWMNQWPTVSDLANATLEDVNKIWAGLGYYSRAKRLHEGAIKISKELNGKFPHDRVSLQKMIPGVGRYTSSAIASISMGEPVGVVDGNVLRVLSRFLAIGNDISSQVVVDEIWKLADQLVDRSQPGDFNQAVMELGATVCTPKSPTCEICPLRERCVALALTNRTTLEQRENTGFIKVKKVRKSLPLIDIECVPNCALCLKATDWNHSSGVENFPRKRRKTAVKDKKSAVVVLRDLSASPHRYFCLQRPKSGLLANLWEFITIPLDDVEEEGMMRKSCDAYPDAELVRTRIRDQFHISSSDAQSLAAVTNVTHIFSHIHQTYCVFKMDTKRAVDVKPPLDCQGCVWMSESEFLASATSTAMKKVFKASQNGEKNTLKARPKRGLVSSPHLDNDPKQSRLSHFFVPVVDKNPL